MTSYGPPRRAVAERVRIQLLVVEGEEEKLILSARNIGNVGLTELGNISVYDALYFDNIVVSKDGIKKIEEALK